MGRRCRLGLNRGVNGARRGGEFELIAKLRERLGAPPEAGGLGRIASRVAVGSGDDAAVTVPEGATATSVDLLVEGVHFRRTTSPPRSIGHKALAAALSDLAAMGAEPGEAYVQLGVPDDLDEAECLEIADGIADVAGRYGVGVVGGDLSRAPALTLAITVVGHAAVAADFVRRSGAGPGDVVGVTGELGGAAAGLILLDRPELAEALDPTVAEALRRRQLEPEPRLDAGRRVAAAGASAMIDISDGLGADASHVAMAGGVALEIALERVPLQDGVAEVARAAGVDPIELVSAAGEDYELLATFPEGRWSGAVEALAGAGVALADVGRVRAGSGVVLRDRDGTERAPAGFDQLVDDPT
jgi:thiamine-monophosphate kinase